MSVALLCLRQAALNPFPALALAVRANSGSLIYNRHVANRPKKTVRAPDNESRRIYNVIKDRALPPGVRKLEVELGEDSTGEPAVWIWFLIQPGFEPTKDRLARINDFARKVKTAISDAGVERVSYVRLRSAA